MYVESYAETLNCVIIKMNANISAELLTRNENFYIMNYCWMAELFARISPASREKTSSEHLPLNPSFVSLTVIHSVWNSLPWFPCDCMLNISAALPHQLWNGSSLINFGSLQLEFSIAKEIMGHWNELKKGRQVLNHFVWASPVEFPRKRSNSITSFAENFNDFNSNSFISNRQQLSTRLSTRLEKTDSQNFSFNPDAD